MEPAESLSVSALCPSAALLCRRPAENGSTCPTRVNPMAPNLNQKGDRLPTLCAHVFGNLSPIPSLQLARDTRVFVF